MTRICTNRFHSSIISFAWLIKLISLMGINQTSRNGYMNGELLLRHPFTFPGSLMWRWSFHGRFWSNITIHFTTNLPMTLQLLITVWTGLYCFTMKAWFTLEQISVLFPGNRYQRWIVPDLIFIQPLKKEELSGTILLIKGLLTRNLWARRKRSTLIFHEMSVRYSLSITKNEPIAPKAWFRHLCGPFVPGHYTFILWAAC